MRFFKSKRRLLLIGIDLLILTCVYLLTSFLTLLSAGGEFALGAYVVNYLLTLVCVFVARFAVRVYFNVWRYANSMAFISLVIADAVGGAVAVVLSQLPPLDGFDIGAWRIIAFVAMANVATLLSRFCYQISYQNLKTKDD